MDNYQKMSMLNRLVVALVGSEELAAKWWTTPNKAFDNECPCGADLDHVKEYLIWHCFCAGG